MEKNNSDEALARFIELKETIDRFLINNEALSHMEVDFLIIRPKGDEELGGFKRVQEAKSCKICYDDRGHPYCYYGPNGCP